MYGNNPTLLHALNVKKISYHQQVLFYSNVTNNSKDAKLSYLVPVFNSTQLLQTISQLKPGQFIKILVNDWTQNMYHFSLVQGRITKVTNPFSIFSYFFLASQ
jgi:hypothetical protein